MDRVPELLAWVADLLGQDWVTKQLSAFEQQQTAPVKVLTIQDFHPLVPGLAEGAALPSNPSPSKPLQLTRAAIRAASHAYDLQLLVHHIASIRTSPKLLGRLRSKSDAVSLLFELAVAVHYLLHGCDVTLPELTCNSNIDVLVSSRSIELEIQCKRKAEGSGRKVPNPLFKRLALTISDAWRSADGEFAIAVECEDRLESSHVQDLAQEIKSRLAAGWQGKTPVMNDTFRLCIERTGPAGHKVPAETLKKKLVPFFADPERPPHMALVDRLPIQLVEPTGLVSPAYFLCSSRQQDTVLENIMESCRDGARQLSGSRPGVVAVHVPEPITQETLERMIMPTAIGDALMRELEDKGRSLSKAAAVVISGENIWPFHEGEWWGGYPGVLFRNPDTTQPLPDHFPTLAPPPSGTG